MITYYINRTDYTLGLRQKNWISRVVFGKTDVISEFDVSAKDCGEIFFPRSGTCHFCMQGVIRDTFLANAFVNASLASLSLRRLEWYRVRGGDD